MKNYYSSAYWMQMTPGDDDDDLFIKYFFLISFHPKCYNELFNLSNKSCHLFPHSFLSSHYILLMLYPCVIRIKGLALSPPDRHIYEMQSSITVIAFRDLQSFSFNTASKHYNKVGRLHICYLETDISKARRNL